MFNIIWAQKNARYLLCIIINHDLWPIATNYSKFSPSSIYRVFFFLNKFNPYFRSNRYTDQSSILIHAICYLLKDFICQTRIIPILRVPVTEYKSNLYFWLEEKMESKWKFIWKMGKIENTASEKFAQCQRRIRKIHSTTIWFVSSSFSNLILDFNVKLIGQLHINSIENTESNEDRIISWMRFWFFFSSFLRLRVLIQ